MHHHRHQSKFSVPGRFQSGRVKPASFRFMLSWTCCCPPIPIWLTLNSFERWYAALAS